MPAENPSKSRNAEIAEILSAILTLKREEGGEDAMIYRPAFRKITGHTNTAILLNQIWYYFNIMGLNPFFKFTAPCGHKKYKLGDSWEETLGWSYDEFTTALKKIGTKVTTGTSKAEAYKNSIVIYWTDSDQMTWYDMNLINFAKEIARVYGENPLGNLAISNYLVRLESQITQINGESPITYKLDFPDLPSFIESFIETPIDNSLIGVPADGGQPPAGIPKRPSLYEQLNGTPPVSNQASPNPFPQGNLLDNELVELFMQKFGITKLTNELVKTLDDQIKYRTEDGGMATYPGGLLWLCETQLGFIEFAKARLDQLLAFPNPVKPVDALKNLRNVAKQRGEDGKGLPGWLQWKQENPEVCTVVKQANEPAPITAEVLAQHNSAWVDGFGFTDEQLIAMGVTPQ